MEGLGGGLDVDATTDIANVGERSIVEGTCPIDGTADGLNFIESTDDGEGSVVGDEESSTDFGELRERGLGQAGAVDKREGAADGSQVWCGDGGNRGIKESQVACDIGEGRDTDGLNVSERRVLNGEEVGEVERELRRVGCDVESPVYFFELWLRDRFKETIIIYY